MEIETQTVNPGKHRIDVTFKTSFTDLSGDLSVFINGRLCREFSNSKFEPNGLYAFYHDFKPGDDIDIILWVPSYQCRLSKNITCPVMKNTLTLNGVEIELTTEQAEKLKAGVCGPKTPAEAPPKKLSWEGLGTVDGYFVTSTCNIWWRRDLKADYANRNIWPTKEYAKASLALAQLLQIRKSLIGDWVPDWAEPTVKYIIQANCLGAYRSSTQNVMRSLSFPSKEMADKVLDDCRDLLEIAKPLL